MVRLDLQYARKQSILLDVKILLRTPAAVLSGDGAY
jgi:lipopolysaccharide/colanic/teichoic acid biosynthesis glycosyltransferase